MPAKTVAHRMNACFSQQGVVGDCLRRMTGCEEDVILETILRWWVAHSKPPRKKLLEMLPTACFFPTMQD
jgi:hypothetical protein